MTPTLVIVPGTNAWSGTKDADQWWYTGWPDPAKCSPLVRALFEARLRVLGTAEPPFVWSTDLGGIGFGDSGLRGWHAAGINLYYYCVPPLGAGRRVPPEDLIVLAHSHGMQAALYAAAEGLKIRRLVTVGGPVRKDMMAVAERARPNIAYWTHIHGNHKDRWQWFGTLFDGAFGIIRRHPLANRNIGLDVSHSEILHKPQYYEALIGALQEDI